MCIANHAEIFGFRGTGTYNHIKKKKGRFMIVTFVKSAILTVLVLIVVTPSALAQTVTPPALLGPFIYSYHLTDYLTVHRKQGSPLPDSNFPTFHDIDYSYESDNGIEWTKEKNDVYIEAPIYHEKTVTHDVVTGNSTRASGTETWTDYFIDVNNTCTPVSNHVSAITSTDVEPTLGHGQLFQTLVIPERGVVTERLYTQDASAVVGFKDGTPGYTFTFRVYFVDASYGFDLNGTIVQWAPVTPSLISVNGTPATPTVDNQCYVDIKVDSVAAGRIDYRDITPYVSGNVYHRWYYTGVQCIKSVKKLQ